jgi:phosphoribosylformimino-5-aminoimidazole carboxamide ribonucleotide (ProFAR) isomerase
VILYPAIDLKGGQCVRLLRGAMDAATVFNDDPAAQAKAFAASGCEWLHVVDLDGAFAGKPMNEAAVRAILAAVRVPVQLGGGIRDEAAIERWLAAAVARDDLAIMSTAALARWWLDRERAVARLDVRIDGQTLVVDAPDVPDGASIAVVPPGERAWRIERAPARVR